MEFRQALRWLRLALSRATDEVVWQSKQTTILVLNAIMIGKAKRYITMMILKANVSGFIHMLKNHLKTILFFLNTASAMHFFLIWILKIIKHGHMG